MLYSMTVTDFADWRTQARRLLHQAILPDQITWHDQRSGQAHFSFDTDLCDPPADFKLNVSKDFISFAESVACHRDPIRWHHLYEALWRLTHGERHLLQLTTDPLIRSLSLMYKAVRRDAHKMKAFVRFRLTQDSDGDHYVAWHQPDHLVVRLTAPFFQRRFSVMRWSILTPDESVHWNGEQLHYAPGVPASEAPREDAWEELWKTFYASIFNPARIKIDMMKREMPVRYWHTMPETNLIPQLLKEAPDRVAAMVAHQEGLKASAADFIPANAVSLNELQQAARTCQGCPLYCNTTQTVFGTGNGSADLMIVGEQPGEQEDKHGLPFIGPAGQLLDQVLQLNGIDRYDLYITNAVKHFKHTIDSSTGKQRIIHQAPTVREIAACKPWLETEIRLVQPKVILGLGLTAARSLLGHGFTMKTQRGQWFEQDGRRILISYHPSAILRMPDAAQKQLLYNHLKQDLYAAWQAAQINPDTVTAV